MDGMMSKFEGIIQQIGHRLLQQNLVAMNDDGGINMASEGQSLILTQASIGRG